jgi:hypothetical protein
MPKLVLSTQAPHADTESPLLAPYNQGGATNVRQPATFRMMLGVAHAVTKLSFLSTKVTFCHNPILTKYIFAVRLPQ